MAKRLNSKNFKLNQSEAGAEIEKRLEVVNKYKLNTKNTQIKPFLAFKIFLTLPTFSKTKTIKYERITKSPKYTEIAR